MLGQTIDDLYIVEEVVTVSRNGTTYLATETSSGEAVNLTVLDYLADDAAGFLLGTIDEGLAQLAQLAHPGIITAYAYGMHQGVPYMVRPVSYGNPLSVETEVAPLAIERVIHIGHELCQILAVVHESTPFHGALNPTTVILVAAPGLPWVQLTGIGPKPAKLPPATTSQFTTELPYLAPEQIRQGDGSPQTDLYSLGVLLYELATGQRPYTTEQLANVALNGWPQKPGSMQQLNYLVPPELEQLTMALLAEDMKDRPVTATSVMEQLAHIGQNNIIPPGPPSPIH